MGWEIAAVASDEVNLFFEGKADFGAIWLSKEEAFVARKSSDADGRAGGHQNEYRRRRPGLLEFVFSILAWKDWSP
jgi:hypothetical protein